MVKPIFTVTLLLFTCLLAVFAFDFQGKLVVTNGENSKKKDNLEVKIKGMSSSSYIQNIKSVYVKVVKADPFDSCTALKELNRTFGGYERSTLVLVDVKAGKCGIQRKINMVRDAFAKGILMIDDDSSKIGFQYSGSYDNSFFTFMISPEDATKLIADNRNEFMAELSFENGAIGHTNIRPVMQFWISSLNDKSYQIMIWWRQILMELRNLHSSVIWRPRFVFQGCMNDSLNPCENTFVASCACGGSFCSPEVQDRTPDVVVKEDIRQKVLFRDYPHLYLDYMVVFREKCLEKFRVVNYVEECAQRILEKMSLDSTRINREVNEFIMSCNATSKLYEDLLMDRRRFNEISVYPTVLINRQMLEFKSKEDFKDQICHRVTMNGEGGCKKTVEVIISTVLSTVFFALIICGLAGIAVILFVCYRKSIKREMSKEIKMQVSTAVQHYYSLTDTK